jgi:hypothetical protein
MAALHMSLTSVLSPMPHYITHIRGCIWCIAHSLSRARAFRITGRGIAQLFVSRIPKKKQESLKNKTALLLIRYVIERSAHTELQSAFMHIEWTLFLLHVARHFIL